jgi:hypothetical protein
MISVNPLATLNQIAAQSISVQGQRGALDTINFTRGINIGVGAGSVANQLIQNLSNR